MPSHQTKSFMKTPGCGHGPDEDVWLPFAETNPLSAFDKYLDEHPELGLA